MIERACRYVRVPSTFGDMAVAWTDGEAGPRVVQIFLPAAQRSIATVVRAAFPAAEPGDCAPIAALAGEMERFLSGTVVDFGVDLLTLERCSPFQRAVLLTERRIPRGRVSTYGLVARAVGSPGAARAVGGALARNPFPIVIPCHRAVRSDGQLGGFQGGVAMKRALLEMEGAIANLANWYEFPA